MTHSLPRRLQEFFESIPVERKNCLRRLDEVFTADVQFRDPFRETRGIDELRVLFERMFRQYRLVEFAKFSCEGDDASFVLTYDMHLAMVVGPTFVSRMASVGRGRDGRICSLVDYYDFSSTLASPIPLLGAIYRRAVNRLFL
jgi:hypothetical protein